jgi:predicted metallo-beta-lactamase superfamily hydrolase
MLKHIKVVPLAAESFGVRSMCTYVETSDVKILLDAGVSVCPNRFGLPPHPREFKAISECRRRIADAANKAEVATLSHYHFDHHTPSFEDWLCNWTERGETARHIYEGKTVLVKNPKEMINYSQRRRGWMFERTGGKYAQTLNVADGKSFIFGETRLRFTEPVFHGQEDSFLGWVLMSIIECQDEKFMFAPDVQGPISQQTFEVIACEKPQLLMIGGPPSYLAGFKVDEDQIQAGFRNLERIVGSTPLTVLEHHLLRDENWMEKARKTREIASKTGHGVQTAAEFLGMKNECLESIRNRLFNEEPPSKEFENWMRLGDEAKKHTGPPI